MRIKERAHHLVSLKGFKDAGLPERLSHIELKPTSAEQYILRMAIRVDGGEMHLPKELEWLTPMIDMASAHQEQLGVNHPFCYVTVRHGMVKSQTDDQWHVDGFSTKNRMFLNKTTYGQIIQERNAPIFLLCSLMISIHGFTM